VNTSIFNVLSQLDRELWIVTAAADSRRGGLVATFVNSASIVPELPRVLVGLARQHHTWQLIEATDVFALHLLSEEQLDWVWNFGLRSGRTSDKLAEYATQPGSTGAPILTDAVAWLECRVETRLDTGDRTVYLAKVVDGRRLRNQAPLTARRMVELAPPERLQELKQGLERDALIDAAAITAWREARSH
jgi:flavin reductase (DIM6/NTAB) family NADH-FMN oxidoreductase RutF